ncbi:MAG: YicC family protein, partial [Desulfuromonadales bacterium]|nr:YicC family protein [Desulfuromonadales bacterium]
MLHSMTGYGKGEVQRDALNLSVEIKSVNHRYADISVKLPRSFMAYENELRKRVAKDLKRGKIDVYVNYELTAEAAATPRLNQQLATAYCQLFTDMQQELGLSGAPSIELIAGQKDVVTVSEAELDEEILSGCLNDALSAAL